MNASEPVLPHRETRLSSRPKYPAILHLSVLTAVLLPIGVVPYVLSRRKIRALHIQINHLTSLHSSVSHELHTLHAENLTRRDTIRQLNRTIERIQGDLDDLKACNKAETLRQADAVQKLQNESFALNQRARVHDAMLRSLGVALADIAAFIEETKLETGDVDPRVGRLREVAMRVVEPSLKKD